MPTSHLNPSINSIIYRQDWHDLDKLHDVLSDDVCGISEFILPLGP